MNHTVTQDPRDHDHVDDHPKIKTKSCSIFKSVESYGFFIQKLKQTILISNIMRMLY